MFYEYSLSYFIKADDIIQADILALSFSLNGQNDCLDRRLQLVMERAAAGQVEMNGAIAQKIKEGTGFCLSKRCHE